jgi:hypothetical protein
MPRSGSVATPASAAHAVAATATRHAGTIQPIRFRVNIALSSVIANVGFAHNPGWSRGDLTPVDRTDVRPAPNNFFISIPAA